MDLTDDRKDLVRTLNKLIETCKDGEYGFRSSAEYAQSAPIRQLFLTRATGCAQAAAELQTLVQRYGEVRTPPQPLAHLAGRNPDGGPPVTAAGEPGDPGSGCCHLHPPVPPPEPGLTGPTSATPPLPLGERAG